MLHNVKTICFYNLKDYLNNNKVENTSEGVQDSKLQDLVSNAIFLLQDKRAYKITIISDNQIIFNETQKKESDITLTEFSDYFDQVANEIKAHKNNDLERLTVNFASEMVNNYWERENDFRRENSFSIDNFIDYFLDNLPDYLEDEDFSYYCEDLDLSFEEKRYYFKKALLLIKKVKELLEL